jgi:hypothetical protein
LAFSSARDEVGIDGGQQDGIETIGCPHEFADARPEDGSTEERNGKSSQPSTEPSRAQSGQSGGHTWLA